MSIPERLTYRNCRNSVHGGGWGETRAQAGTCRWEKSFQALENSGDLLDRALSVPYIRTMPTVAFSGGRDTRVERTSAFLLPPVSREFLRSHPRPFPTTYARIFHELGLGQAAGKTAEAKLGPAPGDQRGTTSLADHSGDPTKSRHWEEGRTVPTSRRFPSRSEKFLS